MRVDGRGLGWPLHVPPLVAFECVTNSRTSKDDHGWLKSYEKTW